MHARDNLRCPIIILGTVDK